MFRLMIKTHTKTGLQYLCMTTRSDWREYTGSGKRWKNHLKKHGRSFETQLILETECYETFKNIAIEKSIEFNIVESDDWANLRIEEGEGGSTTHGTIWITDGERERLISMSDDIPSGWKRGRFNSPFNDIDKQKEFSSRVNRQKNGKAIKEAWINGRFKNRTGVGVKGERNPTKRPEVKEKIRAAQLRRSMEIVQCPHCGKEGKNSVGMISHHFDKCPTYQS